MVWCQDIVEVAPKDKCWRQKVGSQKGEGVAVVYVLVQNHTYTTRNQYNEKIFNYKLNSK
jgi:hypothetical protein